MKYRYDLHVHSCLSPCGDDSMTPASVAGLALLEGLDIIALTDHNTAKNCPAFLRAAEAYGICGIPGMELTASEDVHILCLFESLDAALSFSDYVDSHRVAPDNRPEIFGRQTVMDEDDTVISEEPRLLIPSTEISVNQAVQTVASYGGIALPAHIDKEANGIIAMLGGIPPEAGFTAYELSKNGDLSLVPEGMPYLRDSDAHYPDAIGTAGGEIELDCGREELPAALIRYLQNK